MADIFGNLDNFLENYDENNISSISTVADTGDSVENDVLAFDRSKRQSRSSGTKKNSNSAGQKSQNNRNGTTTTPATVTLPMASGAIVASTPTTVLSTVDLTGTTLSSVAEEMQQLGSLFQSIFNSKNPTVIEMLKNKNVGQIKRSFTTLNNGYNRKPPVTANEVMKLKKKIDSVRTNLNQLNEMIKSALVPVPSGQPAPRSRRSRNTTQVNQICPPVVISLDCDDDPMPTPTSAGFSNRRVTRRSRANGTDIQSNVITLDSDDDSLSCDGSELNISARANSSFETENYVMRIKVKWGGGIKMFEHRRFQKFADIIAKLAAMESADSACIILNLNDRIVHPFDTPDSIKYAPNQFISGRILRGKAPTLAINSAAPSTASNNTITLKIQMETRRQPLRLQIDKQQTMSVLVIKCAEELNCQPKDIKLYFDGEHIDNSSKPEDLDLEGDEILDIRFAK